MDSFYKCLNFSLGFFGGVLSGLLVMILFFPVANIFAERSTLLSTVSGSDVISVANTYIVFITFIFLFVTLLLTAVGIYFTKWFGMTRDREIKDNLKELVGKLESDKALASEFVSGLFQNPGISDQLQKLVMLRVESEIKERGMDIDGDLKAMANSIGDKSQ